MKRAFSGSFFRDACAGSIAFLLAGCQGTPTLSSGLFDQLQGHWEGEGAGGAFSITIAGQGLHYRAGTNWWKTTWTLPPGTQPQQLHATIRESSPPTNGIGTVVYALVKIEDGTLTLAETDGSDQPPDDFESASSRYVARKVASGRPAR